MDTSQTLSDEDYVIQRAKQALETDPLQAKAWMLTAKTLYPNNFGVQVRLTSTCIGDTFYSRNFLV